MDFKKQEDREHEDREAETTGSVLRSRQLTEGQRDPAQRQRERSPCPLPNITLRVGEHKRGKTVLPYFF